MLRNRSRQFPEKILCILCIDVNKKNGQETGKQDETLLQAKLTRAMIRCELADSREYKAAVS